MNFINTFDSLSGLIPFTTLFPISLFYFRKGLKMLKKIVYEEKLKDIDRKDLFNYLIQNRIFIESLSDEDIKEYYKYLKNVYKQRVLFKIKSFLHINKNKK